MTREIEVDDDILQEEEEEEEAQGPQIYRGPSYNSHPCQFFTYDVYARRRAINGLTEPISLFLTPQGIPIVQMSLLEWLDKAAWDIIANNPDSGKTWMKKDDREWNKGATELRPGEPITATDEDWQRDPAELMPPAIALLPGRSSDQIPGDRQARWSSTLNVGVYNLGNVSRKPHAPNLSNRAREKLEAESFRYNMLLEFINKSATHVVTLCEANGLQLPAAKEKLKDWIIVQSTDFNMAILLRNRIGAKNTLLYDNTVPSGTYRDYVDDPTPPDGPESVLWYMITEVVFGYEATVVGEGKESAKTEGYPESANVVPEKPGKTSSREQSARVMSEMFPPPQYSDHSAGTTTQQSVHTEPSNRKMVDRAKLKTWRVLGFHIHNDAAATSHYKVRQRLRQMMIDIVRFQVDIVAGDANKASYSCKKKQSVPNHMESSFPHYVRGDFRFPARL